VPSSRPNTGADSRYWQGGIQDDVNGLTKLPRIPASTKPADRHDSRRDQQLPRRSTPIKVNAFPAEAALAPPHSQGGTMADKPLGDADLSNTVGERIIDKPELPPQGITNENDVLTEVIAGEVQLKRGIAGKFEVLCDEPVRIGGTETYPTPMNYLALSIGF
jgi:hypothetical protein